MTMVEDRDQFDAHYISYLDSFKGGELTLDGLKEKKRFLYGKYFNCTVILTDHFRRLEDYLFNLGTEWEWEKTCTNITGDIFDLVKDRVHIEAPADFYEQSVQIIKILFIDGTLGTQNVINEAAYYINEIKLNGVSTAEIENEMNAVSLLIRDIESERWWWSKPHQDDVDSVYRHQRTELNKKIPQAFDFTKNKISGIVGVDPSEYGLNDDPNQYKDAYNKRENLRVRNS